MRIVKHCAPRLRTSLATILVCGSWFAAVWLAAFLCGCSGKQAEAKRNAETKQIIEAFAADVQSLKEKHGRLPKDEAELVAWLGKPLPLSAWKRTLEYRLLPENPEHFRIVTVSGYPYWLVFQYDSAKPELGVTTSTF